MSDFHPLISSFPLCLAFVILCFELLSIFKLGNSDQLWHLKILHLMLFVILILTFISGLLAADWNTDPNKLEALEKHYNFAKLNLFIYIPVLTFFILNNLVNKSIFQYAYYIFFLILLFNLLLTSNLGGKLVFIHGFGLMT